MTDTAFIELLIFICSLGFSEENVNANEYVTDPYGWISTNARTHTHAHARTHTQKLKLTLIVVFTIVL